MHRAEWSMRPRMTFGVTAVALLFAIAAIVLGTKYRQESALLADANAELNQSKSEAAHARAELDGARSSLAGLQRQLDAARVQQADLRSELAGAASQRSDLQARLDKAQAALRSQQDHESALAARLQARLDRAALQSADLRRELAQAKGRAAELQSRLQSAEARAASPPAPAIMLPVMPVEASFASSFFSGRYTLRLTNLNPGPLPVTITVNGSDKPPGRSAVIKGGDTLDVGGLSAGQSVVVRNGDFAPLALTVK